VENGIKTTVSSLNDVKVVIEKIIIKNVVKYLWNSINDQKPIKIGIVSSSIQDENP